MYNQDVIYVERSEDGKLLCGTEREIANEKKRRELMAMQERLHEIVKRTVPTLQYNDLRTTSRR